MTDEEWLKENRGRWVIRHAGYLITAESFFTKKQAVAWATRNYKGSTDFTVERAPR